MACPRCDARSWNPPAEVYCVKCATTSERRLNAHEAAHAAYHAHNDECHCRIVGHLTEYIANAVLDSLEQEGASHAG